MEPLAYTIPQVLDLLNIGRTKLYQLIGSGELPARKVGSKTLIRAADLQEWLGRLPLANATAAKEDGGDQSA
jgi:excisionase family DNA binding protein